MYKLFTLWYVKFRTILALILLFSLWWVFWAVFFCFWLTFNFLFWLFNLRQELTLLLGGSGAANGFTSGATAGGGAGGGLFTGLSGLLGLTGEDTLVTFVALLTHELDVSTHVPHIDGL
jgi:hypothetical protein